MAGRRARDRLPCGEGGRDRSLGAVGRGTGGHPMTIEVSVEISVAIEVFVEISVAIEVFVEVSVTIRCPFRFALKGRAQHLPHGEGDIR